MRLRLYATGGTLLLATLLASGGLVAVTAGIASAALPPFDPSGNGATQGTLSLYDSTGVVVTGGPLSTLPAYALADTDSGRNGDTAATLYAATPQEGVNPFLWPTGKISLTSTYPDSSAPGPLHNNAHALAGGIYKWLDPGVAGSYAASFPNTNATASWQDLYQLRLLTSGVGQPADSQRYSSATISIDTGNDTWAQVYPVPGASAPTVDTPATITGTKRVGFTVMCDASFIGADSVGYKWFRSGTAINGATASAYKLASADYKALIKCRATGTNTAGATATTSAESTVGLGDALVATTNPSISGTPKPGKVLTVNPGVWTPAASSYKYQWYKGPNKITGATAKKYTVLNGQVGAKLSCKVTAIKKGYASGVKKTAAVTIVT